MDPWALQQFSESAGLVAKRGKQTNCSSIVDNSSSTGAGAGAGQVVGPATLQTIADLQVQLAETRAELVAQQIESASLRREREKVFNLFRLRDTVGDRDEYVVELEGTVKALQDRVRDVLSATSAAETLGPRAATHVETQHSIGNAHFGEARHHAHPHRKLNIVPRQHPADKHMMGDSRRSSKELFGNISSSRSHRSAWTTLPQQTVSTIIDSDVDETYGSSRPVFISTVRGDHSTAVQLRSGTREQPTLRSRSPSRAASYDSARFEQDSRMSVDARLSSSRIKVSHYANSSEGPKPRVAVDLGL